MAADPIPTGEGPPFSESLVDVDGVLVHFVRSGEALRPKRPRPVVFFHGFLAATWYWLPLMRDLQPRATIAFDRPGFGLTERPEHDTWGSAINPYTIAGSADLGAHLLELIGVERAFIVGHSLGGAVAVEFALRHPNLVIGLVLVNPGVYGIPQVQERPDWLLTLGASRAGMWAGPKLLSAGLGLAKGRLLRSLYTNSDAIPPNTKREYNDQFAIPGFWRGLWEFSIAPQPEMPAGRLGEVNVPTIVLVGADDKVLEPELSMRVAEEIPGAIFELVQGAGHNLHEERPDAVLEAIRRLSRPERRR
jgi:pimeloyl-ACP methyl ester carboxylesterase